MVAVAALVLAGTQGRRPRLRAGLAALAVAAAGALALAVRLEAAAASRPGAPLEATVEARVGEVRRGPTGFTMELATVRRAEPGPALPGRVVLRGSPAPDELPGLEAAATGERVRARVRLRAPAPARNPGGRDRAHDLARRGVGAVGRLVHPSLHVRLAPPEGPGPRLRFARARAAAAVRLAEAGEGGALLAALGLGHRAALPPASRDSLARLGLAHLLAVSGLHLVLVAGGAFALLRRFLSGRTGLAARADPRRLALAAALPIAVGYALVAGWGVPVRRALVCLLGLGLGFLRRRPGPRLQPLAAAALLVLVADPATLFAPGAQMSFAASAALLLARRSGGPGHGPVGAMRQLLTATAVALAATSPVAASHFGTAPAAGLVANLMAVPWTAAVLLPSALAAAAVAWLAPVSSVASSLLHVLALPAGWSLAAAEKAAQWLPPPEVLPPPSLPALFLSVVVAALALRARSLVLRVFLVLAATFLLSRLPPSPVLPGPPRAVFLDVGQGDAVLVQGRRASVLVDAGSRFPGGGDRGRDVVLPALAALGVKRLDLLVASHADLDHRGGLASVLGALPVGEVWIPATTGDDPGFSALRRLAVARGILLRERGAGDAALALGDLRVTPLWPERRHGPGRAAGSNDRSLVLRVETAGYRVLLPGDLEAPGERGLLASGAELGADLLKLPHHGSRTSSTGAFLDAVGPRWAVASAPRGGRFGMPHPEVRDRLAARNIPLAWTGRDGAVIVGLATGLPARGWLRGEIRASEAGALERLRAPAGEGSVVRRQPVPGWVIQSRGAAVTGRRLDSLSLPLEPLGADRLPVFDTEAPFRPGGGSQETACRTDPGRPSRDPPRRGLRAPLPDLVGERRAGALGRHR